jgi:hypothetical protein
VSYQGTPLAIPFAMVAGAGEAGDQAIKQAQATGQDPTTAVWKAGMGAVTGAMQGFASQSFLQGLTQQLQFALDPKVAFGLGNVSQYAANSALRYGGAVGTYARLPTLGGLSTFLATVTDQMERDAGRPSTFDDLRQNIGARIATRIPGLREEVATRIGAYGEDVRNQRNLWDSRGLAALPYYRGGTERPLDDPVTRSLQTVGIGRPQAPDKVTLEGIEIPLTIPEQRVYDREYGQMYRKLLDGMEARRQKAEAEGKPRPVYPAEVYDAMREGAQEYAETKALGALPPGELRRRLREGIERERARPRG